MALGQGEPGSAGSFGDMRTAAADRERAVDVLKAAFAEGRLDRDEFANRVGRAYGSRTYAELACLTGDLPAGPLGALPARAPACPVSTAEPRAGESLPATTGQRQRANGMAVASAALGVGAIATAGWTGPLAVLLGILALIRIRDGEESGTAMAVVGALLGTLLTLVLLTHMHLR
jgi:hypothetical protein